MSEPLIMRSSVWVLEGSTEREIAETLLDFPTGARLRLTGHVLDAVAHNVARQLLAGEAAAIPAHHLPWTVERTPAGAA